MAQIPDEKKATYNYLGRSGMKVSNICLGAMTFGESRFNLVGQCDEDLSHQILNRFVEWGGNFIDTANVYGLGNSEKILGTWLEKQPRDNLVIATKVSGFMGTPGNINDGGLSRRHITASIDSSLSRLRTDYVDLYQCHCWNNAIPLDETLRTLDDLVRCGKIRYIGFSNATGWQMQKIVDLTEKLGLNRVVSLQQQYSLVCRESEWEPFQVCKTEGIAVLPWSPLKGGLLTGKVKRGVKPTEGRIGQIAKDESKASQAAPAWTKFDDKTFDIVEAAEAIGKKHGKTPAQVSIRWLLQKDVVPSVIVGARTLAQLDDNMGAASGWSLTKQEMEQLDTLSEPTQPYPYEMISRLNADRVNPYLPSTTVSSL